jgi:hypothetical protein
VSEDSEIPKLPYKGDPLDLLINEDFNRGVEHGKMVEREACARIADAYAMAPATSKNKGTPRLHQPSTGAKTAAIVARLIRQRTELDHTETESEGT